MLLADKKSCPSGWDVPGELVLIPAGEFLMGNDPRKDKDTYEQEQPQHRVYLPDYYIGKSQVTNAQYLVFVEAMYHRRPAHWEGGKPPRGKENHPVVHVSWHDAIAYCQWLSETTGKAYRLPSEAEWEKAARGTGGQNYPWGNQWDPKRCNTEEGGPHDTTPVGQYSPQGDSPYGCVDMAGNVWEWTRTLWGKEMNEPEFKYPYDPRDGREDLQAAGWRVVRGGAWVRTHWDARCAFRNGADPDFLGDFLGFRLVMSPAQPP